MRNGAELVDSLDSLGYFGLTPLELKAEAKARLAWSIAEHGQLATEFDDEGRGVDGRCFQTDAEDLAEGLSPFIRRMNSTLEAFGVSIASVSDEPIDEFGLATVVNGERFVVFEWPDQQPEDLDTWNLSHKRLVEIVNDLLERVGSEERLYAVSGYNDAQVVFLMPEMHQVLTEASELFRPEFLPRPASVMTEHPQW